MDEVLGGDTHRSGRAVASHDLEVPEVDLLSPLTLRGVTESDIKGKPFWETPWWAHSKELQDHVHEAVKRAARGESVSFEATHPAVDGTLHYIEFSLKPVKDEEGKVVLLVPEGRGMLSRMTVYENLQLGGYSRRDKVPGSEFDAVYARFPILGERRKSPAGTLSGGEQQMLAIARALMAQPRLLLLDEPSLGLAPQTMDGLFQVVRELNQNGLTILMVEQNARQGLASAHRGYVLELGKEKFEGPAQELLGSPEMARRTAPAFSG